ncbi:hypothetical protein AYI77_18650 [Shewanella algae]|nr:hypothetical protein AYI77_18650 [Shewanella algae]
MLFLLEAQLLLRIILNIDFDRPSVNGIYNHWMAAIWPWISTLGRMNADSDLRKVRISPRGLLFWREWLAQQLAFKASD